MKKILITTGGLALIAGLIWFFVSKPEPPFGGVKVANETVCLTNKESYFAEVGADNTVLRVIVADSDFINSGVVGDPSHWYRICRDGSKSKRDGVGQGHKYNKANDTFTEPR